MEEKQAKRLHSRKKLAAFVVGLVIVAVLAVAYYYTEGTKQEMKNAVVLAVGAKVSAAEQVALSARLTAYAPPDGRGEVSVELYCFPPGYADPQGEQLLSLIDRMNEGAPGLYLLDQQIYELLGDRVQFRDLSADYAERGGFSGKHLISPVSLPFWQQPTLEKLPACYLAIQREDAYGVTKDAQTQLYYRYQLELLDNILRDNPGKEHSLF